MCVDAAGPARAERERRGLDLWTVGDVEGNVTRAFGYLYEEDTEIASRTPRLDQKERLRHYSLEVSRIL